MPGTLGARLVTLRLHFPAAAAAGAGETKGTDREEGRRQEMVLPRTIGVYKLRSRVGRAFGLWPGRVRLVWETGEWDPAERRRDDPDAWSVGSSEEDSEAEDDGHGGKRDRKGREMVPREVELDPGTRPLGFWIETRQADIRVEVAK